MFDGLDTLLGNEDGPADDTCRCVPVRDGGETLQIDAGDCPGGGRLAAAPACRATVVDALGGRDVQAVRTESAGVARWYEGESVALLVAAGRFADTARVHDPSLARRARRDPLSAATRAMGRSDAVAHTAAESGLLAVTEAVPDGYDCFEPLVGPALTRSLVARAPPPDAILADRYELETGAVVRCYDQPETDAPRRYHIEPPVVRFSADALAALAAAREHLADGSETPAAAVEAALTDLPSGTGLDEDAATLASTLAKHTRGPGVLGDLFTDGAVSDVFATAPVAETPLRVRRDDEPMTTNVRLTRAGASALAGRFRRASGRAFARSTPTLAARTVISGRRIRVSGVRSPVSDGHAFALRAHDREAWRLADLVANDTVPPVVAGLLSLGVERGVACLVTGERGAGKTTLLGALLWELGSGTRTVVVEDTPELPAAALREAGHDVQALRVGTGDGTELTAAEALRTALRLGESALVVGEVRGEEAAVLYEAMRVGAGGAAVLGTVHGDGAATVRERMVTDLGVPESSFADTDLVVTVGARETTRGRERRVRSVEEVVRTDAGDAAFAPLYETDGGVLVPSERLEDGSSAVIADLRAPDESYAETLDAAATRGETLAHGSEAKT